MRRLFAVAATVSLAQPALAQDERPTGDPLSANERPVKAVTFSAVYTADLRSNVDGGIARGSRYLDNLDAQVAIDADRAIGWRGAKMFVYGLYNNGVVLSPALVGDAQSISNVETGTRAARLFEAWVEQRIGKSASVKLGLYNVNFEFDTTQSGGLFLISSHGIGPEFGKSGRNGPSIFPVTSLGVRGEIKSGAHWLARLAILDGVPGDPAHPARTAIKLSGQNGALVVGEVDYLDRGAKVAVGAWAYTAPFDLPGPNGLINARGNKGAYFLVERHLLGKPRAAGRGLAGWIRVGIADARFNTVPRYLGGGLVYTGPFVGRGQDQMGISIADAGFSGRYREGRTLSGTPIGLREVVVEAAYRASLAPWLTVQPDLQYVIAPGGDRRLGDALVLGLRVKIGR